MANKPDARSDFSVTDQEATSQKTTEEVDPVASGSAKVSAPDGDKASTATDDHGSFLLRDSFASQGHSK